MEVFELLASSGRIGGLTLENRFIQSPLHPMLADAQGHVTREQLAYYRERAVGGAALLITEYAFIDDKGSRANVAQLSAADDHCLPGLARLAETIHHAGALAGMQISHAGRQRFLGVPPIVAPSRVPWEALHQAGVPVPSELSVEEIAEVAAAYGRAAVRVRTAGFDLVELHGGHGYLVGQFLSPITNRRGDLYGGSLEARQRFAREVFRSMRQAVGDDFPITVRLSSAEYQEGGITLDETIATARMLEAEGAAAIDVSAGNHHTMDIQVQPMYAPLAANAAAAGEIKRAVGIPVSVVGSITDPAVAEEVLQRGEADFIRLGRPLLADPDYPRKVLAGRPQSVRPCIRCNECLDRGVARRRSVLCSVNFRCGREAALGMDARAESPLRVVVVGGGPAGVEAACVAAVAGHSVTVFEREELGGGLNRAGRPDFKADLLRYRDYLVHRATELVEVRDIEANAAELSRCEPDVVLLATGATASPVADRGGVPTVDLLQALAAPESVGERVVVQGGGQFAAEVAWYLARQGRQVTIAAKEREIATDVGPHTTIPLFAQLAALRVERWLGCVRLEPLDGNCRATLADGSTAETGCDTLVTSDYEPLDELSGALKRDGWRVIKIGDCVSPRRILDAVQEANLAVLRLAAKVV